MSVIPENEKVIKLDQDDDGWVDTHHGISESMHLSAQYSPLPQFHDKPLPLSLPCSAIEQTTEKLTEMKLDGDKESAPTPPTTTMPLVGVGPIDDDSDSDSEPAVDMDDFTEEEDPVISIADLFWSLS